MFRKSIGLVVTVLTVVIAVTFVAERIAAKSLPSAYDPGVSIQTAFQTTDRPLLIEFYSDQCESCRAVTPILHEVYQAHFKSKLRWIMLNVEEPEVFQVSRIFGLTQIPAVYLFDPQHMKKATISFQDLMSAERLQQAIADAMTEIAVKASDTPIPAVPMPIKAPSTRQG